MALSSAARAAVEDGVAAADRGGGGGGGGGGFWFSMGKNVEMGWKIELRKRDVAEPVSAIW